MNPLCCPSKTSLERAQAAPRPAGAAVKTYRRPRLIAYGDLRSLTLGGSPGMGDSGGTVLVRQPL